MAKGRGDVVARAGRAGVALAALVAIAAIAANVGLRVGARAPSAVRELGPRLELAWALSFGAVSGWHLRSHDGPLVQLLLAPYALVSSRPSEVAVASTLITLVLSLSLAWLVVRALAPRPAAVVACGALLLLALHHALDAPAALALLLAIRLLSEPSSLRAEGLAVLLILFAIGWTPLAIVPGIGVLLACALARAVRRERDAVGRGIRTIGLVGIALVLWLAAAPLVGGRSDALLDGAWLSALERAPRPSGALLLFVVLGALGAGRIAWRREDAPAFARVSGAVALALPALLGWRLHEEGSLLWPLAATIAMEGWAWRATDRAGPDRAVSDRAVSDRAVNGRAVSDRAVSDRAVSERAVAWALIGWAALFGLGWVSSHAGTFSAGRWLELRGAIGAPRAIPEEEDAVVAWARRVTLADPEGCVVWPVGEGIARLRARVRGPLDPLRAVRSGEWRADAIARARCRSALLRVEPFELDGIGPDGWFVGPDLLEMARAYAPSRSLSPTLVVAERRAAPLLLEVAPLTLRPATEQRATERPATERVAIDRALDVRFLHALPSTSLVRLFVQIDAWPIEAWLGAPRLFAQPLVGSEPIGEPVPLPPLPVGRSTSVLVSSGDAATWAWTRGTSASPPEIDGVRLSVDGSEPPLLPITITVQRAEVIFAPERGAFDASPLPITCQRDASLLPGLLGARAERATLEGPELRLSARADSVATEVSVPLRPCADQCLFVEAGLVDDTMTAHLTLESIGASGRAVLVDQRLAPGWRRPIVVPLPAEEALWLRFAVANAEGGGRALALYDPRLGPCTALFEVVHALHQGQYRGVPDDTAAEVIGDELRLALRPADAIPPRIEVPLPASFDAPRPCFAVDLALRDASGPAGLMVGVRTGQRVFWLERRVLTVDDPLVLVREAPLVRFSGEGAFLVFSAWPIGEDSGGTALFIRPRVYDCDREAGWSFGSRR